MSETIARRAALLAGTVASVAVLATLALAWGTAIRTDFARGDWALAVLDLLAFPIGIVRGIGFWLGQ